MKKNLLPIAYVKLFSFSTGKQSADRAALSVTTLLTIFVLLTPLFIFFFFFLLFSLPLLLLLLTIIMKLQYIFRYQMEVAMSENNSEQNFFCMYLYATDLDSEHKCSGKNG